MDLSDSKTASNLRTAFTGESEARNKYTFFAAVARREGYQQIAGLFLETADNEKEHAEQLLKLLGELGDTVENLQAAAAGERHEWTEMYRQFEREAREEGFHNIADILHAIAKVEAEHEKRFITLRENIQKQRVFSREEPIKWRCRNCGYVHEGKSAPEVCPACTHPQGYYEVLCENY